MRELQNELFPLVGLAAQKQQAESWTPKVDIKEQANEFVLYADIPGVDPKEIEIGMEGNTLIVKGEKKAFKEDKDNNFYRLERVSGKFYRQFTLPENVDADKISAKAKQGVLAIHVPKAQENKQQRKIRIEEED